MGLSKRNRWRTLVTASVVFSLVVMATGIALANITLWMHANPTFVSGTEKLISNFEKENPQIKVELVVFPYPDLAKKVLTGILTGDVPDVYQGWGMWFIPYIRTGKVSPVPSWVTTAEELEEKFQPSSLGAYYYKGKYYGISAETNFWRGGLHVNLDILEQAGLTIPETWAEIISSGKKLTKRDSDGYIIRAGLTWINQDNSNSQFLAGIMQNGGNYWDEQGYVKLNTPEAVKSLSFYRDLVLKHEITSLTIDMSAEVHEVYFKRLAAMLIRPGWVVSIIKAQYPDLRSAFVALPSIGPEPPYYPAETGWGYQVPAAASHKEEAWKFVKFATLDKGASRAWLTEAFLLPALKSLEDDPELLEAEKLVKVAFSQLKYGRYVGDMGSRERFTQIIFNISQEVFTQKTVVKDAVAKMEKEINEMLKEYR
ncbi:MAG: extracellular solute-binding protein [Clostridia bacterium]|jgi:multiple sugar transport system substrate-binding protein|nr:extracellular solute-binding protein [Clostridia bacterium]